MYVYIYIYIYIHIIYIYIYGSTRSIRSIRTCKYACMCVCVCVCVCVANPLACLAYFVYTLSSPVSRPPSLPAQSLMRLSVTPSVLPFLPHTDKPSLHVLSIITFLYPSLSLTPSVPPFLPHTGKPSEMAFLHVPTSNA